MTLQALGARDGYTNGDKQGLRKEPPIKQDQTGGSCLSRSFLPVPPHSTAYPPSFPLAILVRKKQPSPKSSPRRS